MWLNGYLIAIGIAMFGALLVLVMIIFGKRVVSKNMVKFFPFEELNSLSCILFVCIAGGFGALFKMMALSRGIPSPIPFPFNYLLVGLGWYLLFRVMFEVLIWFIFGLPMIVRNESEKHEREGEE